MSSGRPSPRGKGQSRQEGSNGMISIDVSKCSGCKRCEVSCSFIRTGGTGRAQSRIKVMKVEEIGIDFPVLCQLCKERFCADCPEGAIQTGELGQILVDASLCNGCGLCERLCPIGAIELNQKNPYVCDLCEGDPECVKECNLGALRFEPEKRNRVILKTWAKKNEGLSPDEKRLRFAVSKAAHLRKQWTRSRRT